MSGAAGSAAGAGAEGASAASGRLPTTDAACVSITDPGMPAAPISFFLILQESRVLGFEHARKWSRADCLVTLQTLPFPGSVPSVGSESSSVSSIFPPHIMRPAPGCLGFRVRAYRLPICVKGPMAHCGSGAEGVVIAGGRPVELIGTSDRLSDGTRLGGIRGLILAPHCPQGTRVAEPCGVSAASCFCTCCTWGRTPALELVNENLWI